MVCLKCGAACHYHDVESAESVLPQSEAFPYETLDAVAVGGVADLSFGDRQPEARVRFTVGSCQHGQPAVHGFASLLENPFEIDGRA